MKNIFISTIIFMDRNQIDRQIKKLSSKQGNTNINGKMPWTLPKVKNYCLILYQKYSQYNEMKSFKPEQLGFLKLSTIMTV